MKHMLTTEFRKASESDSRRLLVVLHGLGDSTAGYRWLPPVLELPWMNYLLVNGPDPYFGGFSWYDFIGDFGPGVRRSRALLFELLDAQRANGFPTEQTTLFGFSQGCVMTIEVGLSYPHHLAGLVGISGAVHEPEKLVEQLAPLAFQQRFLVTHGTDDTMLPFAQTREQINILKAAGLRIEWREFVKGHTIAGEEELDAIRNFVVAGYPRP